jgi:hypothetical protein
MTGKELKTLPTLTVVLYLTMYQKKKKNRVTLQTRARYEKRAPFPDELMT